MSLSDFGGILWIPKAALVARVTPPEPPVATHYLAFQIRSDYDTVRNLAIQRDHPLVMQEAYDLLARLLDV